jgi:hypothetical protein
MYEGAFNPSLSRIQRKVGPQDIINIGAIRGSVGVANIMVRVPPNWQPAGRACHTGVNPTSAFPETAQPSSGISTAWALAESIKIPARARNGGRETSYRWGRAWPGTQNEGVRDVGEHHLQAMPVIYRAFGASCAGSPPHSV